MARPELKRQILTFLRNGQERRAREVVEHFDDLPAKDVRQAIRDLIDGGELAVTLDWKVRITQRKGRR